MPGRAVVIRTDHLGDLILTTPLFRALDRAGYQVDVVARKTWIPILELSPHITQLTALESICEDFPKRWMSLAMWLRRQKYDVIILPHAKPPAQLFAAALSMAPVRIAMWAGLWGRATLTTCLRSDLQNNPRHMSDVWLDCARHLGIEPDGALSEIFLSPEEREWAKQEFSSRFGSTDVIGIHPGCSGNTCNLPSETYRSLVENTLNDTTASVVLTGSAKEREAFQPIFRDFEENPRIWNSMGELSLRQLAAVISFCRPFVSTGTGPLHIASALATPTVSPFCTRSGTSKELWGNLRGPSVELEPPQSVCARFPDQSAHCDFCGEITATQLSRAVTEVSQRSHFNLKTHLSEQND